MKDYVVVDIETTGLSRANDRIIELGAIRIRDGKPVEECDILVNPGIEIDDFISELTGITNEMVKDKPYIDKAIEGFLNFLADDIIVGHNVGFDLGFIKAVCNEKGIVFERYRVDTMYLARKALPNLRHHKLKTLCKYYNIVNENAHRAISDCKATYNVFLKLQENGIEISPSIYGKPKKQFQPSEETVALNEFLQLLKEIVDDDIISEKEVVTLNDWLFEHEDLCDRYPFETAKVAIDQALDDGILEQDELLELKGIFKELSNPNYYNDIDDSIPIAGKNICLSGEFESGSKAQISEKLSNLGAIMQNSITQKTDYLIVGAEGNPNWQAGTYGSKIKKALDMQSKGKPIMIFGERDFLSKI